MLKPQLAGLYAITDATLIPADKFEPAIDASIAGGARIIQYRDKSTNTALRKQQATALLGRCRQHNVLCLINDDVELAASIQADGVHIGRDDAALAQARSRLGDAAIIGMSCYNDLQAARQAQDQGANYVAFGRFFSSTTKPGASPASLDVLAEAHRSLDIPICAIGGITPRNAPPLLDAGADMLAVIGAVFGEPDIRQASKAFSHLFA